MFNKAKGGEFKQKKSFANKGFSLGKCVAVMDA